MMLLSGTQAIRMTRSRIAATSCLYACKYPRRPILRRQLFEGRNTYNNKKPLPATKSTPKQEAIQKHTPPKFDETSFVQRGPVPSLFYLKHDSTMLKPQYSGAHAWMGLGTITGINLFVLGLWNSAEIDDQNQVNLQKKDEKEEWMMKNFTTDLTNLKEGRVWSLATASISHIDVSHFGGNMFALWLFGFNTYRVMGTAAFTGLYLLGGVACSLTHVVHNVLTGKTQPPLSIEERKELEALSEAYGPETLNKLPPRMAERMKYSDKPSLGASGSVMAISAAAAGLFPMDQMRFRHILLPLPVAVGIFVLSDLSGVLSEGSPTDHAGHLGGLLMGAAYVTMAWYNPSYLTKSFRMLRRSVPSTGGDLPLVYRYKQMMNQGKGRYY